MYTGLPAKYPFLSDFNQNLNLLDGLMKYAQISKLMELRPVGSKLFYAGGRRDRHDEATCKMLIKVQETRLKSHFSLRYIMTC